MKIAQLRIAIGCTCLLFASACDPITLGLGVGGGYLASQEISKSKDKQARAAERREERETQYYAQQDQKQATQNDGQISSSLTREMLGGGLTQILAITPEVRGGVVTLYGTVPSPLVAERAIGITQRTPGVQQVVSRLTVVDMQITPTGQRFDYIPQAPAPMPMQGQMSPSQQQSIEQGYPPQPPQNYATQGAPVIPTDRIEQAPQMQAAPQYAPPFQPAPMQDTPPQQGSAAIPPYAPQPTVGSVPSGAAVPGGKPPYAEGPSLQELPAPPMMPPPPQPMMAAPPLVLEAPPPEGTVERTLPGMGRQ